MNASSKKLTFNDLNYIDPFVYKGVKYKSISQAYYASAIVDKKALAVFLNSTLDPFETFIIIKDDFKRNQFDDLLSIMRARFLKDERSIKLLLKTKTRDKWVKLLQIEVTDYPFSQQELF